MCFTTGRTAQATQHRRNFVCDDGGLSPPLLKVVVTVTTTFFKVYFASFFKDAYFKLYKNTNFSLYSGKRIVFFLIPEAFCGLKYTENAIAAGAPPGPRWGSSQHYSRLGSGHPSPYPTTLGAFSTSMLAPWAPRSLCPLTPNPGDATGHHHFLRYSCAIATQVVCKLRMTHQRTASDQGGVQDSLVCVCNIG